MARKRVHGSISFLVVLGLAVLITACPKKPPEPVEPAAAPPPTDTRAPQPVPTPPVQGDVKEQAVVERSVAQAFQEALRQFENQLVHFDFDRSEIRDQYKSVLDAKAGFLRKYPNVRIQIEGNCDERGTVQYNLALGDRRANSAKAYLVALGIDGNRISTISFGKERPLDPGHTEEAWAMNRRDKFVVIGQ
jgi:peptidoglycan-associated lipoprotein